MTASEQIISKARRLKDGNPFLSWQTCLDKTRAEHPALSAQATQEGKLAFANAQARLSNLSKQDRRDAIQEGVAKLMREEGIKEYTAAWNRFAKEHPEFANDMLASGASDGRTGVVPGVQPPVPGEARTVDADAASKNIHGVPISDIARLCLPVDASELEADAARLAGTADPAKLFDAMVKWVSRTHNVTPEAAQAYCVGRFPKMAQSAQLKSPLMSSSQGTSYAG